MDIPDIDLSEISTEHTFQRVLSFLPVIVLLIYTLFLDTGMSLLILGATAMGVIVSVLDSESDVDTFLLFAFLTTSLLLTLVISHYILTKLTVLFILIWLPISERLAERINSRLDPVDTSEYVILLFLLTGFFLALKIVTVMLSLFGKIPVVESTAFVFYDYTLVLCSLYFFTSSIYPLIYSHVEKLHLKVKPYLPETDGIEKTDRIILVSIAFVSLIASFILLPYSSAGNLLFEIGSVDSILSIKPVFVFYSSYFTSWYLAPTNFTFAIFILIFLYLNPVHSFTDNRLIAALLLVSVGATIYFVFQLYCPPSFTHTVNPSTQALADNILEWMVQGFQSPTGDPNTCVPKYSLSDIMS